MRGLPGWAIGIVAVLAGLLLWIGWIDRHEAGYLPFVMGVAFALFALASLGAVAAGIMSGEDA